MACVGKRGWAPCPGGHAELGRVTVPPEQCGRQGIAAAGIRAENCVASLSLHGCYCQVEER